MELRLLGTLEVAAPGWRAVLAGQRRKALLAALALRNGSVVPAERLVELVWGDRSPAPATATLYSHVHHLRAQLGPAASLLRSEPPGYVLRAEPDAIDVFRFERLAREGRVAAAGERWDGAADLFAAALALWRGPALADLRGIEFAERESARLEERHLSVLEDRLVADLALGRHHHVVGELEELAAADPLREGVARLLVLALYRSGRQAEALRAFQRTRRALVDQLGIEPGRSLRTLEEEVLRQDPALDLAAAAHAGGRLVPIAVGEATPPVATPGRIAAARRGIPVSLTSFVGRGVELGALGDLVAANRLVTVVGPGGAGKSRLVAELVADLAEAGDREIGFVDVAVVEATAVPGAVAVGLQAGDRTTGVDQLCELIGDRSVLIVLDGCERVVDAVADLAERALTHCPEVAILATSRERLQVAGEVEWRLPSLSCPVTASAVDTVDDVLTAEAAQLLLDRSGRDIHGLSLDDLAAVADICRQLDGLPLALELAAAHAATTSLPEVAAQLEERALRLRRRGWVARHRTLRDALAWGFELLEDDERTVLAHLSVFVGGFTLSDAEAVAASDDGRRNVAAALSRLVQTSMLTFSGVDHRTGRYRLLGIVRRFAAEALEEPDASVARRRHATHLLGVATQAGRHLRGPDATVWLGVVADDLEDLRAALRWSTEHGEVEIAMRIAATVAWFAGRIGCLPEVRAWLEPVVADGAALPPEVRLLATTALAAVGLGLGDHRLAGPCGEDAIRLARQAGDGAQLAAALVVRGASATYEGDDERARACLEEAEALADRQGDRWCAAWARTWRGVASRRTGRLALAEVQLDGALATFRALGDRHGEALPLVQLALVAQARGDLDVAAAQCRLAQLLGRTLDDRQVLHVATAMLGRIELERGDPARARELLLRSLRRDVGAHHGCVVATALEGLAVLALPGGAAEAAVTLWGAAAAVRDRCAVVPTVRRQAEREEQLAAADQTLPADAAAAALRRGAVISVGEAVALGAEATAGASGT